MFNFRLINLPDGNQIIDRNLKTPYEALTPEDMIEYIEVDKRLAVMDRMKKKQEKEAQRKRKLERNPFFRMAFMCGLF